MTIRFEDLLPEINRLARQADRKPSDWVRNQIRQIIDKQKKADKPRRSHAA